MKCLLATLAAILLAGVTAVPAFATVEITVYDSVNPVVGYSTTSSCGPGCETLAFSDADFQFLVQIATSNAPGGPAVLSFSTQLKALKASSGLEIDVSDTSFSLPTGPGTLVQTLNTNTAANGSATGTLSGTGYYGDNSTSGNVFFCQTTGVCTANTPPINFTSFSVLNPGGVSSVPVNFSPPFSLDEVMNATVTSAGFAEWQGTLSAIQAVPEPASVVLLGGVLVALTRAMRRKGTI